MNLFSRLATAALVALILTSLAMQNARAEQISATLSGYDLVKVGNPGNAADTNAHPHRNGFGSVANDFWIGENNVKIGQYAEFLNAVAASDPRGLWVSEMNSDQRIRGIDRSGSDGSYVYTVVGPNGTNAVGAASAANRPITHVNWFRAARFANWMANGKPTGAAGTPTIDDGAYNLGDASSGNPAAKNTINPNTGAAPTFYIPTENEWYKAAYYSPVKGGPSSPGYYFFGTQSDTIPGNGWDDTAATWEAGALGNKNNSNQVNWKGAGGGRYAVTGGVTSYGPDGNQNLLTDVGTFTNSYSYYGAFDMSGNILNWNDLTGTDTLRGLRGSGWGTNVATYLSSAARYPTDATGGNFADIGFRLAAPVPEPTTYAMALAGLACGGYSMYRRRKQA